MLKSGRSWVHLHGGKLLRTLVMFLPRIPLHPTRPIPPRMRGSENITRTYSMRAGR